MRRILMFMFCAVALCFCIMTAQASAQATRTWVSGTGDDANPCSRTAPCKTFAGAISKTAAGGEIDALDPGGFGTLTITKAITIDGGGGQVASVLASGTVGFTVNAGLNDRVTLRNLRFNGAGTTLGTTGVNFIAGLLLNVESCWIFGFNNNGIDFEPTTRAFLRVTNSTIDSNGLSGANGGIFVSTTAAVGANRVLIEHTDITNNGGFGITIGQHSIAQIHDDYVSRNGIVAGGDYGILADGTGSEANIEHTVIASNNNGGLHARNSSTMRVSFSDINDNAGAGVFFESGASLLTYGNNRIQGNTGGPGTFSGPVSPI